MNKVFVIALLFVAGVHWQTRAQEKLLKHTLSDHIKLKIPAGFIPMSETDMWQRVSSYRKSIALYTDLDRLVELGVNRSFSVWKDGDYQMMFDVYKSSILQLYDKVDFIKEEITDIRKQKFVVFEFVSKIFPDETTNGMITKYTYIQYTIYNGQTLVFNFSCPNFVREKWESTAHEIMNSVVLK